MSRVLSRTGRRKTVVAALLALASIGTACSGESGESGFWSIATGNTGGTYFPQGAALGKMIGSEFDGVTATAEVTGGSVENLRLLDSGDVQIAFVHSDPLSQALEGKGDFEGKPIEARGLSLLFIAYTQIATRAEDNVTSVSDLEGKRVAVGEAGSASEVAMQEMLAAAGMSFDDLGDAQPLGFTETTDAFRDGRIDAGNYTGVLNAAALQELSTATEIGMIALSEKEMSNLQKKFPHLTCGEIPKGTYPGQEESWSCVPAAANFVAVKPDFDRQDAYRLTKVIHEQVDKLIATHPSAKDITLEKMLEFNNMLPLHPGAIDYFLEKGVEVPKELYPEEWEPTKK